MDLRSWDWLRGITESSGLCTHTHTHTHTHTRARVQPFNCDTDRMNTEPPNFLKFLALCYCSNELFNTEFDVSSFLHLKYIPKVQPRRCDVSQLIYFCKTLCMFQKFFQSIIRSSKLHIQHQAFVRPLLSAVRLNEMEKMPDAACAVLSSWWWTQKTVRNMYSVLQK